MNGKCCFLLFSEDRFWEEYCEYWQGCNITKLKVSVSTTLSLDKQKLLFIIYNILCILWETLNGCTQQSSTYFLQKPTRCSQWQSVKKFQINVAELISCPCRGHFTRSCLLIKFYGLISLCKVVVAFKTLNEKDKLNTLHWLGQLIT